jgi:D,D-heptose 1,7-bisphosphate phosphatase
MKRAIFLDRDGTLNEDPGYLNDPAKVHLLSGVGEALAALKKAGFLLVVISNQSGVGRGLIQKENLDQIHLKIAEFLGEWNVQIDHYELCFHRPEEDCACRKPKPQLIFNAAKTLGIDISQSYMVGDKVSDVLAGQAAGCKHSLLVRTGDGISSESQMKPEQVDFIGDSLLQVSQWILHRENASS